MGLFSGWFKKSKPEDYEQVLAALSNDIKKRQTRLSEIRLRERRSTLLFSVYALALWLAYVSLWYMNFIPNLSVHPRNATFERTARAAFVPVGPVVILFIRRIVQIWYTRIGDAEEKSLVSLRKQQREKIEQIKKQTNYYSTRNLLERYDDTAVPETPLRHRVPLVQAPTPVQQMRVPVTPKRTPQGLQPSQTLQPPMHIPPGLQQQLSPSPQRPMPPPRKQWYDKLADAILGDDDSSVNIAASRYALICQKCFAHNGLVKESVWEDIQYVCPKCGHFNPSANAVRQARFGGRPSVSPSRPDQDVPKIRRGSEGGSVSSGEGGGRRISNIGNGHGLVPELVQVELDPDSDSARHLQDDEDGDHGDREEGKGARGGKEELKEGDGDGGEEKLDERSVRMDVDDEDSW